MLTVRWLEAKINSLNTLILTNIAIEMSLYDEAEAPEAIARAEANRDNGREKRED